MPANKPNEILRSNTAELICDNLAELETLCQKIRLELTYGLKTLDAEYEKRFCRLTDEVRRSIDELIID